MAATRKDAVAYQPPSDVARRLPMPDLGFVTDWYLEQHRDWWDHWEQLPDERTWRASQLGNCLRAQTLQRMGIPSPGTFDAKTVRAFAWGDEVHKFARKMFWRLGLVVAEEPTVTGPDITGHVDMLWAPGGYVRKDAVAAKENWSPEWTLFIDELRSRWSLSMKEVYEEGEVSKGVPILGMELKSTHSFAMKRIFEEGPQDTHRTQAGIYKHLASLTAREDNPDDVDARWGLAHVDRWHIGYVGKDSVGMLMYEVEDSWVEDAIERLAQLAVFWNRGSLPPCDCRDWKVKYCEYNEGDSCCGRNLKGTVAKALRGKGGTR